MAGGRRVWPGRLVRSLAYVAAVVPVSLFGAAGSLLGRAGPVVEGWTRLFGIRQVAGPMAGTPTASRPGAVRSLGYCLLSLLLGLLGWFLIMMMAAAVVRGIFYGLVTDGPYGAGTWGGPTKAGAWAVHAAVAIPTLVLLPVLLHGLAVLHTALIERLYGRSTGWWVLPATGLIGVAGGLLFYSWIQQL